MRNLWTLSLSIIGSQKQDRLTLSSHLLTQTDLGHEVRLLFLWRWWKGLLLEGDQRRAQLLGGRCRGRRVIRPQLRRALLDLLLVLSYNDAYYGSAVVKTCFRMGLTQFLAEGGVVPTLVVEIDGISERAGGDSDASDCCGGGSLHGCNCESGVAGDGRSRVGNSPKVVDRSRRPG